MSARPAGQAAWVGLLSAIIGGCVSHSGAQERPPVFAEGERIVLIGNTLADRSQHSGWLETRLHLAYPEKKLTVRHMGWSADEVALMPRPLNFGTLEEHLTDKKADTVLMFFGGNESFAGQPGLEKFKADLAALVNRLKAGHFNGKSAPRLVLVSPMAHEHLPGKLWPDPAPRNAELERYAAAMRDSAAALKIEFIDLFHPTRTLMSGIPETAAKLTINGIHLTDDGYKAVTEIVALGLGITDPLPRDTAAQESLRALIIEKNRQFMLRWRPVNAEYVFGRRKEPFGVLSFPPEMALLDKQIAELDQKIWAAAKAATARQP